MPTSVFFDKFANFGEQQLYEDLLVESIQIHGIDTYYVPRHLNNFDQLYGIDDVSSFDNAFLLEMYIKSVDGFTGDGSFFSKFGLEIRDQIVFTVARRSFMKEVGDDMAMIRPNEGDLVYYPLNNKCFEIKFVDDKPFFYPFGELPSFDLTCELFEFSAEKFDTGVPEIDSIEVLSQDMFTWAILDSSGIPILDSDEQLIVAEEATDARVDPLEDNEFIQGKSEVIVDQTETNRFGYE